MIRLTGILAYSPTSSIIFNFNLFTSRRKDFDAHNAIIIHPFDQGEIKDAIFSMLPDKSPGPDGMNPDLFQSFWDVVVSDVTEFCMKCLNDAHFPPGLNLTSIVLTPKKNSLNSLSDLRPIALCNVVYKDIVKLLANRMKDMLKDVISKTQSTFFQKKKNSKCICT